MLISDFIKFTIFIKNDEKYPKYAKSWKIINFMRFHEFLHFSLFFNFLEIPEKCSQTKSQRIRQKIKIYEKHQNLSILIFHRNSSRMKIAKDTLKYSKWWNIIKNDDFLSIFHDLSHRLAHFSWNIMKNNHFSLIFT